MSWIRQILFVVLIHLLLSKHGVVNASAMHGGDCVRETSVAGEEVHEGEEAHDHEEEEEEEGHDSYNLTLAIVSVFVLWVVSFMGAGFPLLLAIKRHPWIVMAIRLGSFAGSGVMLATAFVHMLYSANENLTSSCLPESWLSRYGPWAFLFACLTIIILQTIDYILYLFIQPVEEREEAEGVEATPMPNAGLEGMGLDGQEEGEEYFGGSDLVSQMVKDSDIDEMERNESTAECNKHVTCKDADCNSRVLLGYHHRTTPKARLLSNIIISEVSICVHSLVIGLSLGLTSSSEFVALFIAIIFHQFLEGIALGSVAAESGLGNKLVLLFAVIYSITTPTGIAIGIAVRESLDPSSPAMLYTTGILDSIAAGALIYLSLGDHMNSIRIHAKWMRQSSVSIQIACFTCFYIGAAVLLVLAIWA